MLQCLSKAFTLPNSFLLFLTLIRTCVLFFTLCERTDNGPFANSSSSLFFSWKKVSYSWSSTRNNYILKYLYRGFCYTSNKNKISTKSINNNQQINRNARHTQPYQRMINNANTTPQGKVQEEAVGRCAIFRNRCAFSTTLRSSSRLLKPSTRLLICLMVEDTLVQKPTDGNGRVNGGSNPSVNGAGQTPTKDINALKSKDKKKRKKKKKKAVAIKPKVEEVKVKSFALNMLCHCANESFSLKKRLWK